MQYFARFIWEDETIKKQTLKDHLTMVAAGSKEIGSALGCPTIFYLAGIYHDMGKYRTDFQNYLEASVNHIGAKKKIDHGRLGAVYVYQNHSEKAGYESILAEFLAMVIAYHHGGLKDYISFDCHTPLNERIKDDYIEGDKEAVEAFEKEIFPQKMAKQYYCDATMELKQFFAKLKGRPKEQQFFWLHLLLKFAYSAVIDMDRWDSRCCFGKEEDRTEKKLQEYLPDYVFQLNQKLCSLELEKAHGEKEAVIRGLRREISQECLQAAARETGIYTLTVPTGGGKTLASLRFALQHANLHKKERIIFILPYTTIIEQNAEEIRSILNAEDTLLEHHCNVVKIEKENEFEEDLYEIFTQRWNLPIIFTTMVRFLESFYKNGKQDMQRLHQMKNSILIFDEIQNVPIKCISLFNEAVNFLSKICKSTSILCSATQPCLQNTPHPIELAENQEIVKNPDIKFLQFKRVEVRDLRYHTVFDYDTLCKSVLIKKDQVDSILVIVNTRRDAGEIYKRIKSSVNLSEISLYFLSSWLCPSHRKKVIRNMKKNLAGGQQMICISTPILEAGVDISFACVFRHLTGLDSVAQAAGRENRHGERESGDFYIFRLKEERLGSLREVKLGEDHADCLMNLYQEKEEMFLGYDLLSLRGMEVYYQAYYHDSAIESQMTYPAIIHESKVFLKDLLSDQTQLRQEYESLHHKKAGLFLTYPLESAGKNFSVIGEDMITILVPYQKGADYISQLKSYQPSHSLQPDLTSLQQYCVSIYQNDFQIFMQEKAFIELELGRCVIYMLREGFYDDTTGLTKEKNMRLLEF